MKQVASADEELALLDRIIALDPGNAVALMNRGAALHKLRRLHEALASIDRAIALSPDNASAFNSRGHVLRDMNRLDEALASYDQAIALRPNYAESLKNRGTVLLQLLRLEEAEASFDRAIALKPNFAEAYNNRGSTLHYLKRLDKAVASFDRAIALRPGFTNAVYNRGLSRLLAGNFREGWADYEWRLKSKGFWGMPCTVNARIWEGEDLAGRSIAIYAVEQGLGDVIQFARYLPFLVQRKAKVTLLAPAKLIRLLRSLLSGIEVVTSMDGRGPFDFHCALMSLPFVFGTELSSIPNDVPYVRAERELVTRWKNELGDHGFKVGIGWQVGVSQDSSRSIPLAEFVPLSRVPNVRLISLQKKHGLDQLTGLPARIRVENLGDKFDSGPDAFIDTAAVMANLDLIITADISIAHVAGALGRPTWVGLKYVPDWRWLLDREDCPWYPTMRLFRQETDGDWKFAFSRIERELRSLTDNRNQLT
jgi:tetratricopeptide (TPR) repeat protein